MMLRLTSQARLWLIAALVALSAAGWSYTAQVGATPRSWSAAHAWHLDHSDAGPDHWVANDLGPVRLTTTFGRVSLAEATVTPRQASDTHIARLEPYSTADNSDQSDASARVEARAGPIVCQQSRALLALSRFGLRSRTRSSCAPRAPPAVLRLA